MSRVLRTLVIVLAAGCVLGDTASYSPEEDRTAMASIASAWSASSPSLSLSLSLCEDVNAPPPDNTCQVEHMVRGDGLGRRHEEHHGGCTIGGCPFRNVAFVRGTASGVGMPGTAVVAGEVTLSSFSDGDPYAFPYHVELHCVDPGQDCFLTGTLNEDGTLELDPVSGVSATPLPLARTGAATCP